MYIAVSGLRQQLQGGAVVWPDLAEALVAEGGIFQMLFTPISPQPVGGGYDLRRVLCDVWVSRCFGRNPPLALRLSIARVLTSPAAISAVNAFLDAAAAAYQEVVDGMAAMARCPLDVDDVVILHGALVSCDARTALKLLPWLLARVEILLAASGVGAEAGIAGAR